MSMKRFSHPVYAMDLLPVELAFALRAEQIDWLDAVYHVAEPDYDRFALTFSLERVEQRQLIF